MVILNHEREVSLGNFCYYFEKHKHTHTETYILIPTQISALICAVMLLNSNLVTLHISKIFKKLCRMIVARMRVWTTSAVH